MSGETKITPTDFKKKMAQTVWNTPGQLKRWLDSIPDADWQVISKHVDEFQVFHSKERSKDDFVRALKAFGLWDH